MDLTEEITSDVTIMAVAGRLDMRTASVFSDRLSALLRSGQTRVLIEASQLAYISSSGFRALLIGSKRAIEEGGRLALCGVTAPIWRVFEIGGLDKVLETYGSRDEALAKLSAG